MKIRNVLFLALVGPLLCAGLALAQPNYRAHVEALAAAYPAAFACAHTNRPCAGDFATIVAIELHKLDPNVGANRKRGTGDFSQDALAIKDPVGTTTDINGGRSFVIDYISCAGGGANCSPSVGWASVGGVSGWVDPTTLVDPRGGSPTPGTPGTPGPTPTPTPTPVDLSSIEERIAQIRSRLDDLFERLEAAATRDQVAQLAERVEAAHVSVLEAINLGRQQLETSYSGRFLGMGVTLRPNRP